MTYKKLTWGLGFLIVLFIGLMFYVYYDYAKFKEDLGADSEKPNADDTVDEKKQETPKDIMVVQEPPREARPGYKWEWHGDHWDEIPIAQNDVTQQTPIAPVSNGGQQEIKVRPTPKPTYDGPLTFHAELLKTNPVKALRLQQEERGHWSAAWIPPFPPDDTEAQEYARATYLIRYYLQTYGKKLDTPEYEKEKKDCDKAITISEQMRATVMSYPYGARKCDLMKLTWISLHKDPVVGQGRTGRHPSEYFGDAEIRRLAKKYGTWKY